MSTFEDFDERLERYLAGELPEAERDAFEKELDGALEAQVFDAEIGPVIREARGLPKEITPEWDSWEAIAGRLEQRDAAGGNGAGRGVGQWLAAAGVVFAVGAAVYFGTTTENPDTLAENREAPSRQEVMDWQRDFDQAEEAYRAARTLLLAELDSREVPLAEDTRATLEKNVLVIDEAVKEIRVAVEDDPSNPRLMQMLVATRERELDFLETLVRIPAGS